MEKEINKIKIEYRSITPPKFLITNGVDDLWHRVDSKKQFFNMYFAHITTGILIFVILLGSIGIISAQAKKGSTLYPVKVFTQKAVAAFSKTPLGEFYNSQINQIHAPEKNFQPTPLNSPTPTVKPEPTSEIKNDDFKNEDKNNSESNQNQNSHREDIKGASVFENNKNSDNSLENSHGKNDNSNNNESQNHSNDGNSNSQNSENRNQRKD